MSKHDESRCQWCHAWTVFNPHLHECKEKGEAMALFQRDLDRMMGRPASTQIPPTGEKE